MTHDRLDKSNRLLLPGLRRLQKRTTSGLLLCFQVAGLERKRVVLRSVILGETETGLFIYSSLFLKLLSFEPES